MTDFYRYIDQSFPMPRARAGEPEQQADHWQRLEYESMPRDTRMRRLGNPAALIKPDTAERIWREVKGHAIDVFPIMELLQILDPRLSRLCSNDWEYRGDHSRPPLEMQKDWRTGPGAGRVIRKDRAIAWACDGGRPVAERHCWALGVQELESLGFTGMSTLAETEAQYQWLIKEGAITLRFPRRFNYAAWNPYSGPTGIVTSDGFGNHRDNPIGWVGRPFNLPV